MARMVEDLAPLCIGPQLSSNELARIDEAIKRPVHGHDLTQLSGEELTALFFDLVESDFVD